MAVKKVANGWHCTLTGHTYDSEEAANHYDRRQMLSLRGEAARKEDADLERLVTPGSGVTQSQTAEGMRRYIASEMLSIAEKEGLVASKPEIDAFIEDHADYEDAGDAGVLNGHAMKTYLHDRGIRAPRYADLEAAYASLKTNGTLILKQGAVEEQARMAAKARASAQTFNETEAYTLPLEELERRARGTYIR